MFITDILSYGAHLLPLIGIVLFFTSRILFETRFQPGFFYNKPRFIRYVFWVGLGAILTQWCYVYAPERIFTNADHHVIEHLGFGFGDRLVLANQQRPQTAIWDDKPGELTLTYRPQNRDFQLQGELFTQPIFSQVGEDDYQLRNPVIDRSIQQQFTLAIDSLVLEFKLSAGPDSSSFRVLNRGTSYGPFTIPVAMPLRKGYSLGGLLAKARADAPGIGPLVATLDSVYLLRTAILGDDKKPVSGSIVFFPSRRLLKERPQLTIDGSPAPLPAQTKFTVALLPNQPFYVGLGGVQNKVYTVRRVGSGSEWLIHYPQREYLKKLDGEGESLFLTSSAKEVTKSGQMAGFYYPIFDEADNHNHLSANLTYRSGPTQETMAFRVINYDQNDLSGAGIRTVQAGDTLRLQSQGMSQGKNQTTWLFRINDLKASNPLQFWHLLVLTLLLLGGIWGCILLTPYEKQTKAEYIVYMLLLVLMIVRSILLWRTSTFLPLEDASPNEYRTLANLGWSSFRMGALFSLGFLGLVAVWKVWNGPIQRQTSRLVNWAMPKPASQGLSPWLLIWFLLYGLAFIMKAVSGPLERIGSVYMPLAVYFLLEFVLVRALFQAGKNSVNDPDYRLLTRLNWFICLGYLALSDAGFSIIFLVSTLVYNIIVELTFPKKKGTSPQQDRLSRFIGALIWAGLLWVFVWFSPQVGSFLFRHTLAVLYALAGGIVLYGFWRIWRNDRLMLFGRAVPRLAVPVLCLGAGFLLVGLKGTLLEKVQAKSYARYRSEVLFKSPDQIIESEEFRFNQGNDSKLLRAAQNQWLINHFYAKANPDPEHYFRVLPSFKKGSPYLTQICDLVTVRYIIGEHSQFVVTFLLGMMILLILAATDADTRFNRFSMLRVQLLCLLFATGVFVWMAATNRIVFLGQDFPLLSLNSFLTCLFTFSILLLVIIWGDRANIEPDELRFVAEGQKRANSIFRVSMLAAIFLVVYVRQDVLSVERFNLDQTVTDLESRFNDLNSAFKRFQDEQRTVQKRVPLAAVVQQFDSSAYSPRHNATLFGNSRFAQSAYGAYVSLLTQQQNDPDNLVYVYRRNDNSYEFVVNKHFYNVSSPDVTLNAWRGHLLGAAQPGQISFVNRQTNQSVGIATHREDPNLQNTLGDLFDQQASNNIRLTSLPASWSVDSLPLVMISHTLGQQPGNRAAFVVKSGPDMFRSNGSAFALVLRPNDVVQFQPVGRRRPATLQYQQQTRQYLAKNVWLNGHQQFFYPLGAKFLWPYHFANLVKVKFEQSEAANQHSVALSLDARLTEQVYDLAAAYFQTDKWDAQTERARAFNLVVLGSDGQLKALCDFKKGTPVRIDPNRMSRYNDLFADLSLNAQTEQERLLFGNRCLLRMDNGPASTFKPILYSAVTAQYRFDWESLTFGGLDPILQPGFLERTGDDFRIRKFGGNAVRFTVGLNNMRAHDMDYYISQSTNTYNSMMVYLGSLTKAQLKREHQYVRGQGAGQFLTRGRSDSLQRNFPILKINGTDYRIRSMAVNWQNSESILGQGLWLNYGLPVQDEHMNGRDVNRRNLAIGLGSTLFNKPNSNMAWCFPEPSHLFLLDRNNTHNAIVQCATGADPTNATPYKMAEMAASLFSFNRQFQGSVLADNRPGYQPMAADASWRGTGSLTRFYSQTLFQAMHNSTLSGTATKALGLPVNYPEEFLRYHFYAKTGTISGDRDGGKRDKHLMLIISRDPLHNRALTPDYLRKNRFMVLYFSFYKQSTGAEWDSEVAPTLREMVRTVINSDSFKALMQ